MTRIKFDSSALREAPWYGHLVRFAAGGVVTAATAFVAKVAGPVIGGIFLAVPAIFVTSVAMIEKLENSKVGPGTRGHRARRAALTDAAGAALGSVGLVAFALVSWALLPRLPTALGLSVAGFAWAVVGYLTWYLRRRAAISE